MSRNFLFWLRKGVDGFRADAIPYLWKEEGTDCENLPMTHAVVKFFRAVIDYARPNTLLLAEACQKPKEVVKYFGHSDECHAGYHFPLMPQIYKALALKNSSPIIDTLSLEVTPEIPQESQWFTFLRCHDELSLELVYVSEADRKFIHENYCKKPEWDFRLGQGISSRLSELMDNDPRKIGLIYSIMLTLPGTPVVYYGDEFGKKNDHAYYEEQIKLTSKDDTRFLVRGRIDWEQLETDLSNSESHSYKVFSQVSTMLRARTKSKVFGRGSIQWLQMKDANGNRVDNVLSYQREYENEHYILIHNLSDKAKEIDIASLFGEVFVERINSISYSDKNGIGILEPYGYYWISW